MDEKKSKGFIFHNSMRKLDVDSGNVLKVMYGELEDNLEILKRNNNSKVKFNQNLQFLHMESLRFLSFQPSKPSEKEKGNLAIELSDEFSALSIFKLLPVFNYQADNEGLIMNGDEVYVACSTESSKVTAAAFLNASKPFTMEEEQKGGPSHMRELNASFNKGCSFQINIFSNYLDNFEDNLKVNDIVGISFSELGLHFISVGYKDMENQTAKLSLVNQNEKVNTNIHNSNGLYRIENFDERSHGGFLEWGKHYKIKHIA